VAIDAGMNHAIALKSDGTVVSQDKTLPISGWKNIVAVSAGDGFALGLKADGTVVSAGTNTKGQCNTSGWKNVTAISAGWEHAVALLADGTVKAAGDNSFGQCNVSKWTDIIQVSTCYCYTIGLKDDGTVVVAGSPEYEGQIGPVGKLNWENIIAVTAGMNDVYGLKEDGTVLMFRSQNTNDPDSPQLQLSWDYPIEITSFDAGYYHLACMDYSGELYFRGGGQAGEADACRLLGSKGAHIYEKEDNSYCCFVCGYTPKFSGTTAKCTHIFSEIIGENDETVNRICNLCGKTESYSKSSTNILADRLTETVPSGPNGNYGINGVYQNSLCCDYTGVTRYGTNFYARDMEVVGTFDVSGTDILECRVIAGAEFDPNAQASVIFYADDIPVLTLTDIGHETQTSFSLPIYDVETLKVTCINTSYISSEISTPQVHIILDGNVYTS